MKLIRRFYIGAGIVWGIILGAATFLLIGGGVAGIFFLYVFGDNAWPDWVWFITYTIATITGLITFGVCVYLGWHFSRGLQENAVDSRKQIVRVTSLLALSVIVIFGYALYQRHQEEKYALLKAEIAEQNRKRAREEYPYKHADESETDYYCRVIRKQSKLEVIYHGKSIKIVPELLLSSQGELIFAIAGSYDAIRMAAKEIVITTELIEGGEELATDLIALPKNMVCGKALYFVKSRKRYPAYLFDKTERVDCHIPSLRFVFPMKIRRIERNG